MNLTPGALVAFVLAGICNGLVTGITGGNGMAVVLSVLLLAGQSVHDVIGLCLATQVFTMTAALVQALRVESIAWGTTALLCLPAAAFAFAGGSVALLLPPKVLILCVVVVLVMAGKALLRRRERPEAPAGEAAVEATPRARVLVTLTGLASGFMAGLVGGGGNILVAHALHRLLGFRFRRAVAMSICLGIVSAILGVAPYLAAGRVALAAAPAIVLPALATAWIVAGRAQHLAIGRIQQGQGLYLLFTAVVLAVRQLF